MQNRIYSLQEIKKAARFWGQYYIYNTHIDSYPLVDMQKHQKQTLAINILETHDIQKEKMNWQNINFSLEVTF